MEGHPRPGDQPYGAFTLEATRALRALSGSHDDPLVLAYHQTSRRNPYQELLYGHAWAAGIAALPLHRAERLDELLELMRHGVPGILHLHWTNQVLRHATSSDDARSAREAFVRQLDAVLAARGRIVWTVHNILPHGARFEDEEVRLQQAIVERSTVVHVLAKDTPSYVAPWFTIPPDKVVHVPHPSYAGAYEAYRSRDQARHDLGLMPDELVFLVGGQIRPYKGLTALLDAWDDLPHDRPRRLVMAGLPSEEPGIAELIERAALHPTVLVHPRFIPSDEVQTFQRAADIAVLPYLRTLNSGALLLALTFGLPVIVPAGSPLADEVAASYALTFDAAAPASLAQVVAGAASLATDDAREAALAAAAERDPATLSQRFARILRERVMDAPAP